MGIILVRPDGWTIPKLVLVRYVLPAISWGIAYRNRNRNRTRHRDDEPIQPLQTTALFLVGMWFMLWSFGTPPLAIMIYLATVASIMII